MKKYDLLIKNACIYTMNEDDVVIKNGVVGVEGKCTLLEEVDENKKYLYQRNY